MENLFLFIALGALLLIEVLIIHYFGKQSTPSNPFLEAQCDPYFKQYMELSNSIDHVRDQHDVGILLRNINAFQQRHTNNGNHSSFEVDIDTSKLLSRLEIQQVLLQQQGIYLQLQF